ncbi:C2 domain-containing protein [Caldicellulosiruptor morganii]|uniref:Fimbrial assembly protein n=1 Tax=Caldicellulosiruptor morganii TaxID=1387555 RepID=A0ABY7BN73_9FIRM|nr:hypothetical protein [Caldicellulosiruptor morganii]WAM33195.1 fimbrial assembly protein [Caldicellulosiruptor morganii]
MPPVKDINLLEAYYKQFQKDDSGGIGHLLFLIGAFAFFLIFSAILITQSITYSIKVDTLKTEVQTKRITVDKIKREMFIVKLFEIKKAFIDEKFAENRKLKDVLLTVEKLLPVDVSMESLQIEDGKMTCNLAAKKLESVVQFVYNVQNDSHFTNITFNGASENEGTLNAVVMAEIAK